MSKPCLKQPHIDKKKKADPVLQKQTCKINVVLHQ